MPTQLDLDHAIRHVEATRDSNLGNGDIARRAAEMITDLNSAPVNSDNLETWLRSQATVGRLDVNLDRQWIYTFIDDEYVNDGDFQQTALLVARGVEDA